MNKTASKPKRPRLSPITIRQRVRELGPWFHNLDLAGVSSAPEHFLGDYPNVKRRRFANAIPTDLSGLTVLDIGCNAGFDAIEMKRRGARRVVGIDADADSIAQARFAAEVSEQKIARGSHAQRRFRCPRAVGRGSLHLARAVAAKHGRQLSWLRR